MQKIITCGQYECCIEGTSELVKCVPSDWVKDDTTLSSNSGRFTIFLKDDPIMYDERMHEGWSTEERHGILEAAYIRKGKTIFSLQHPTENEVIVRVRSAVECYTCTGIHYGMMLAMSQKCVGLHGVTLVCGNEIVILSAPSGTGKTTLAKLAEKYSDAVVINGDFALLSPTEDGVVFEPTPFCGTSRRSLNHRFRVNRIVFLSQAMDNYWKEMNGREALMRFMDNAFIPTWDNEAKHSIQENILKCISLLRVNAYAFAPKREAAEEFLEHIRK